MSFETSSESELPAIDEIQIYGAQLLRAAKGLETGMYRSMILEHTSGSREVVIQSGAKNLLETVKTDFGLHGFSDRPVTLEELNSEEVE
ncbi:MAG: hypothetical protein WD887_00095 [Candidatus Saccharimonadales bacterium]